MCVGVLCSYVDIEHEKCARKLSWKTFFFCSDKSFASKDMHSFFGVLECNREPESWKYIFISMNTFQISYSQRMRVVLRGRQLQNMWWWMNENSCENKNTKQKCWGEVISSWELSLSCIFLLFYSVRHLKRELANSIALTMIQFVERFVAIQMSDLLAFPTLHLPWNSQKKRAWQILHCNFNDLIQKNASEGEITKPKIHLKFS